VQEILRFKHNKNPFTTSMDSMPVRHWPLRRELAIAHVEARADLTAAKTALDEILEGDSTGEP
jgi:hypothetical protein